MFSVFLIILGHAIGEAISHWPITMKTLVQFQASPCGICGGKSGIGSVYF